jgi:hypothetical protein
MFSGQCSVVAAKLIRPHNTGSSRPIGWLSHLLEGPLPIVHRCGLEVCADGGAVAFAEQLIRGLRRRCRFLWTTMNIERQFAHGRIARPRCERSNRTGVSSHFVASHQCFPEPYLVEPFTANARAFVQKRNLSKAEMGGTLYTSHISIDCP